MQIKICYRKNFGRSKFHRMDKIHLDLKYFCSWLCLIFDHLDLVTFEEFATTVRQTFLFISRDTFLIIRGWHQRMKNAISAEV